jgi:RNA recognition motif. (a.k.a. RRM, RBD, or RNP domain)
MHALVITRLILTSLHCCIFLYAKLCIVGGGRIDPLEEVLGPFPCVRLRGMPFEATVDDVLQFFQGLVILDVVMVVRNDGRGAGESLVIFTNHMDLNMALSRDKQHMGRRYIEIFQAKRMDYYHAVTSQMSLHSDPRGMNSMHSSSGHHGGHHHAHSSQHQFGGNSSSSNRHSSGPMHISSSMNSGAHHLHGAHQQQHHNIANSSHTGSHHHGMNSSHSGMQQQTGVSPNLGNTGSGGDHSSANQLQQQHQQSSAISTVIPSSGNSSSAVPHVHTGVIRMRGLPFSATKADIVSFFQGLSVLEESVQFVVRSDGRVTGEAFVTLASSSEAEAAMLRNGNHIGSRYVELFPSAIEEAARHTSSARHTYHHTHNRHG